MVSAYARANGAMTTMFFSGELDHTNARAIVVGAVDRALEGGAEAIVVNLSALVRARNQSLARGATLTVRCEVPRFRYLFDVTGLRSFLEPSTDGLN
jgi:anti-anti-sigma regulatory factor